MADETLTVSIVADSAGAATELAGTATALGKVEGAARTASTQVDGASRSMRDMGDAASTGAREARSAGDAIDSVGGRAGGVTTGLRDMADAVEMIGFPGLAAGMGVAATGFEAIDGAATLFAATSGIAGKAIGGLSKALNILKVSILTNPIFIIAAIIIAIGAAFIIAYEKCEGFRKVVDAVFKAVKNIIKGVWDWIKSAFAALGNILTAPFKTAQRIIAAVWVGLKSGASAAINFVKNIFSGLSGFFSGIVSSIARVFSGVVDAITRPFKNAMDWVKRHFKLPSINIPFIGGGKSAPAGMVVAPGLRAAPGVRASAGTSGGTGVTIVINGPIDAHSTVRQLRRLFRDDQARLGRRLTEQVALT